ncbi:MAG: NADH-quinone oxidoreductase subunit NuoN [Gammaproteobacteria bacterium]|nr:MAG: NADH-quinone oxidoreductase subunit NuoN [Gammaproteobacteria bacterium]
MIEYITIGPEIVLLTCTILVLVIDLFLKDKNITYYLTISSLIFTLSAIILLVPQSKQIIFYGSFISDNLSALLKVIVVISVLFTLIYSKNYLKEQKMLNGEFLTLSLFALLGMMIMISSANMLNIYLGLELLSLSLYAMVALQNKSKTAAESAIKYFVLGALASGLLLYGMSLIYGITGTLNITQIGAFFIENQPDKLSILALIFIISGLGFKLGAVPFHMWLPDVYEGSPTPVTTYIATAPKVAVFAIFLRLLTEGFITLHIQWAQVLIVLSILSLVLGNIVAIAQHNLKRMLAYSAISHAGFIMLGLLAGTNIGYSAAVFYVITYAITTTVIFGIILFLSHDNKQCENLEDLKELNKTHPWFAFLMLIALFSLIGVPPTVGFYAKLAVLHAIIDAGYSYLAIIAVITSVIGAFYYLRVIKYMYFDKNQNPPQLNKNTNFLMKATITINALIILALGIYPAILMTYTTYVMK